MIGSIVKFISGLAWWIAPSIIAVLLAAVLGQQVRISNARADAAEQRASYKELSVNVAKQNDVATAKLDALTAKAKALQIIINRGAQERAKQDARNKETVAGLQGSLRNALAGPSRLCQSAEDGGGTGGRGAASDAATGAAGGSGHGTAPGRVLPNDAQELLARLTREADEINIAYASCKSALTDTQGLNQ